MTGKRKQKPTDKRIKQVLMGMLIGVVLFGSIPVACIGIWYASWALAIQHDVASVQEAINEQCPELDIKVERRHYDWDPFLSYSSPEIYCEQNPNERQSSWQCSCPTPTSEAQGETK
ncbi:MAG: hypothetical protein H6670_14260 [Anaerolineaceae bacterium]|nr:hypothetical protein [Anaerolineaceae bacterium]